MALRALLAVLFALVLLGAAIPVVDDARRSRTATALDDASDRVRATSDALVATSDPVVRGTAARRVVRLDPPTRGWGARAGRLRVRDGRVAWQVGDGRWHGERAPRLVVPDGPLVVDGPARLRLTHRRRGGESVVVRRGFKTERGTTGAHVAARTPPGRDRRRLSMSHLVRR